MKPVECGVLTGELSTLESRALGVWRLGGECVEATFAVVAVVWDA